MGGGGGFTPDAVLEANKKTQLSQQCRTRISCSGAERCKKCDNEEALTLASNPNVDANVSV